MFLSVLFYKFPGGPCPQTPARCGCLAAPRQISHPVLSQLYPLLFKTIENPGHPVFKSWPKACWWTDVQS